MSSWIAVSVVYAGMISVGSMISEVEEIEKLILKTLSVTFKNAVYRVTKVVIRSQVCEFFGMPADSSKSDEGKQFFVYRHINLECRTCM